jgi:hypothetical protein
MNEPCNCITHSGPHYLHMDALWKAKNHVLLEQAGRYERDGRASRDVAEVQLYYSVFLATMRLHAQEEMARLNEKLKHVEKLEKGKN